MNHLSDLFHYCPSVKKHGELRKGVIEYKFLFKTSLQAFYHLEMGNYEKFDSLVGENACQIRAVKVAKFAKTKDREELKKLQNTLRQGIEILNDILEPSTINALMQKGLTLQDVIDQNDLHLPLSTQEMALIQSYFLSEMKECWSDGQILPSILRKERCSPSALQKKYPEVSYSFVEKLAKKLRIELSKTSVAFVRDVAKQERDEALLKMVGPEYQTNHKGLHCIPTFWTFKTLFKTLENIPLVFHVKFLSPLQSGYKVVDEAFLYYKPSPNGYVEVDPQEENLHQPACIIQGAVCSETLPTPEKWKEAMRAYTPLEMLLAMGADHRQYPDPDHPIEEHTDPEYRRYKLMAKRDGFSLNNPSTFFVQHIYCQEPRKLLAFSSKTTLEYKLVKQETHL